MMAKALTVTLMVWALCAYGMYSYRKVKLDKAAEESRKVENVMNDEAWVGKGKIEIEGEAAEFKVMYMTVPAEGAFFARMFLTWRGKTHDIIDDTQYAGELVTGEDIGSYLHWEMPEEIRSSIPAIWATMPKGERSHFLVERPDHSWARSVFIQWQQMDDTDWFASFDRQLAMVEE